ncbi:hypothetical protein, partial [Shewanella baltica]|uniref:hypothetical protein n=1 Tax=Shewanella baltica TaxID=62322 RepID=UPI00217DDBFC
LEYRPVTPGVAGSSPVRSANISISPNSNVRAFSYLEFIYFNRRGRPVQQHPCLTALLGIATSHSSA